MSANGGETRVQFEYGTSTSYGLTTSNQTLPAGASAVDVEARLERLTPATTYNYRVVATNAAGVTRGGNRTFRTVSSPSRPGIASEPAVDVTLDAATLSARGDPNRQATTVTFEYGTSTVRGGDSASVAGSGDADVRVQARATGLRANTTYQSRVRATNATGTVTGSNRAFRTGKIPIGLAP